MKNTFLVAAVLLPALSLAAQRVTTTVATAAPALASEGDKVLATWLQVACTNEISLAEMALKQGGTDVRAFAQTVIDGHTAFAAKLQPYGTAKSNATDEASPKDAATKKVVVTTAEAAMAKPFDHAALIQDLGKRCLESQSAILAARTGVDFDRLYMPMQVASTVRELDMVAVFQKHASSSLGAVLAGEMSALRKQCEQATRLCQRVCEPASNGDARQPPTKQAP